MRTQSKRIRHPYHLKQVYIHWKLRLLRHEHTARRVHHQHTSYPLLALMVLSLGAVLVQSTASVNAATSGTDSLTVSAVVAGPVPVQPATIETPLEGTDFTSTPIDVTGTCAPHTYVQLFRNNFPSGTSLCTNAGEYAISTDLFKGANELIVKTYNYADQAGADSAPRNVTYNPPVPVTPPVQGSGNSGQTGGTPSTGSGSGSQTGGSTTEPTTTPSKSDPLVLRNDFLYRGYFLNESASWKIAVSGGTAPYSINVEWGDGTNDLYTSTKADTLTLTHTYKTVSPDGGFPLIVTASDAAGNKTTLQITALVVNPQPNTSASVGGGTTKGFSLFGLGVMQVITYVWTTYGVLCLVLLSFWLGEARELRVIRNRFRMSHL